VSARFAARLAERRSRAAQAEGDYSVWVRRSGAEDLPGVSVRTRLAAPDAFRLRVDAMLGTAVDARAHRDTLVLDAPALGIAAVTDGGKDHSGRQDIGGWVWRAFSAGWSPPAEAWSRGSATDSAWVVSWEEAGDSLQLAVAANGLPRSARLRFPGGGGAEVRYARWASWNGVMWPARIVAAETEGRLSVTLQASSLILKGAAPSAAAALRVPSGAVRMSRKKLLSWLERMALSAGADTSGVMGQ
jgi:hypothetical protein